PWDVPGPSAAEGRRAEPRASRWRRPTAPRQAAAAVDTGDPAVDTGDPGRVPAAAGAARLRPGVGARRGTQPAQRPGEMLRVVHRLPGGQHREVRHAEVDTDRATRALAAGRAGGYGE